MNDEPTWSLFQCLKPAQQTSLMQLQWDLYGTRLDIAADAIKPEYEFTGEDLEEIGRQMKQKPHSPWEIK